MHDVQNNFIFNACSEKQVFTVSCCISLDFSLQGREVRKKLPQPAHGLFVICIFICNRINTFFTVPSSKPHTSK